MQIRFKAGTSSVTLLYISYGINPDRHGFTGLGKMEKLFHRPFAVSSKHGPTKTFAYTAPSRDLLRFLMVTFERDMSAGPVFSLSQSSANKTRGKSAILKKMASSRICQLLRTDLVFLSIPE